MAIAPVYIGGKWSQSTSRTTFHAANPRNRQPLPDEFPVSPWPEVESALTHAAAAAESVANWPGDRFANFLEAYAREIEAIADQLIETASLETGLPVEPRLKTAELPRTTGQLRQAAAAARDGSWALPTIDQAANIRSMFRPIGPVAVFGPNNFPFAFNSIAGGDFAAAVAAGNPVLAKAHTSHPRTSLLFAQACDRALAATEFPPGFVQMIYRISHEDGARLVSHPLIAACGYTGSRSAGLFLKEAADRHGKPIYLELSSINPLVILPGALRERLEKIAEEYSGSCLMGAGQFCTNPGLVLLIASPQTEEFIASVTRRFESAPAGTLLSDGVHRHLVSAIADLRKHGAQLVTGDQPDDPGRCCYKNTLLRVDGRTFLADPEHLQAEAFGNAALFVIAKDVAELTSILQKIEGNLTGSIYSDSQSSDDALYQQIEPLLRCRVGRLLNDKMPTGVAVSPAMNHGGPFPATGHPGFTAVGIPASLRRFAVLHCYDAVRPHRLPPALQDKNPTGKLWRLVGSNWTQADLA